MQSLPEGFTEFTAPGCDRLSFIRTYLEKYGVATAVVPVEGKNHIFVNFPSAAYNPMFKIKTVIAHYDRVPGSPGANDNSSSVFSIMIWAARLAQLHVVHNVRIFFTDGEELGGAGGVSEQGAFGLASLFRKLGITRDDVYVFDCTGRGDIPVVAKTFLPENVPASFKKEYRDLEARTESLIRSVSPRKYLKLPVPYSDNAGFLACGIPAVAVTLLPEREADLYMSCLMRMKNLENAVMNRAIEESTAAAQGGEQKLSDFMYREKMPETWRILHTEYDNTVSLDDASFALMAKLLASLAAEKTLS